MYISTSDIGQGIKEITQNTLTYGFDTGKTFENVGYVFDFKSNDEMFTDNDHFSKHQASNFMTFLQSNAQMPSYRKNPCGMKMGVYDSRYYDGMMSQMMELIKLSTTDDFDMLSRQYVIQFDKTHCFQTIQFLIRNIVADDKKQHDVITVITNMRSCNIVKNFEMDCYISHYLGQLLKEQLVRNNAISDDAAVIVRMHFGSLHIFKNDIKQESR
jgi:hypothetical protein